MPLVMVDPEVFLCTPGGEPIFHVYKDNDYVMSCWYQFVDGESRTGYYSFDVRDLPEPYTICDSECLSDDARRERLSEFFAQGHARGHTAKSWLRVCGVDLWEEEGQ